MSRNQGIFYMGHNYLDCLFLNQEWLLDSSDGGIGAH